MARGRRYTGAVLLACVAVAAGSVSAAAAETVTFSFTGDEEKFIVPAGVTSLEISATGAGGVDIGARTGGKAAIAVGTIPVTPGSTLYVSVGGPAATPSGAPTNSGFGGGAYGGGGASDLRTVLYIPQKKNLNASLESRLLVAGGGGAAGDGAGANGGDAGQAGGAPPTALACAGRGGTALSGGLGGDGMFDGDPGRLGFGGDSAASSGGGGGGLYGGGGAAANTSEPFLLTCAGGGGGSSLVPAGGSLSLAPSSKTPAQVRISFTRPAGPPSPDATAPQLTALTVASSKVFYRLSEPALVRFVVERARPGKRKGKRCVVGREQGRKCTSYRKLRGSFSASGGLGLNSVGFKGRLAGKALAAGGYRLVAVATDPAGNRSQPARRGFRIGGKKGP